MSFSTKKSVCRPSVFSDVIDLEVPIKVLHSEPLHFESSNFSQLRIELHPGFPESPKRSERLFHGLYHTLRPLFHEHFALQQGTVTFTLYQERLALNKVYEITLPCSSITGLKSLKLPTLVEELVGELLSFPAKSPGLLACLYSDFPHSEICPRISDLNGQCACPSPTEKQADLLKGYESDSSLVSLDTLEHYLPLYWRTGRIPQLVNVSDVNRDTDSFNNSFVPPVSPIGYTSVYQTQVPAQVIVSRPIHPDSDFTYAVAVEVHSNPSSIFNLYNGLSVFLPTLFFDAYREQEGTLVCVIRKNGLVVGVCEGDTVSFTGESNKKLVNCLCDELSHLHLKHTAFPTPLNLVVYCYWLPKDNPCRSTPCVCPKKSPPSNLYSRLFEERDGVPIFDFSDWLFKIQRPFDSFESVSHSDCSDYDDDYDPNYSDYEVAFPSGD